MIQPVSDSERATLAYFRDHGNPAQRRRAQIILLSEEAAPLDAIAQRVGLSHGQVYFWLHAWAARRIAIFPAVPGEDLPPLAVLEDTAALIEPPPARPGIDVPRLPLDLRPTMGVLPDDPAAEAGRKVLLFHFERMLANEPSSRLGSDIEAVHDMRVATRRMRSAVRLFAPFFLPADLLPYRRHLRRIGTALGDVRDLDVFMEKAQRYVQKNPDLTLAPLFAAWQIKLDAARARLLDVLDSPKFDRFILRFHTFLTTPGLGAQPLPEPGSGAGYQVRHVAPRLIYERYEAVRAYETILEGASIPTLHALRIALKRLRYALESFEEVLGPEARQVINEVKGMQDHLGDLNDAQVAADVLREFIDTQNTEYSGVPLFLRPDISGVLRYAEAKEAEKQQLLTTFPAAWERFTRQDTRLALARAVAAL